MSVQATGVFHICHVDDALLRQESARLLAVLRSVLPGAAITEIGSTAVEGVLGKQDLDFVALVPTEAFGQTRATLDSEFQRDSQQFSSDSFQAYRLDSSIDAALQLTVANGPFDHFNTFVQLLRADHDLRRAYNEMKISWDGKPMDQYRAAKRFFIENALAVRSLSSTT